MKATKLKIYILGVLLYFSPKKQWFNALAEKWFPDPKIPKESVDVMRCNFWKCFLLVFALMSLVLSIQTFFLNTEISTKQWLKVIGVFIALTATLGRGGWGIHTIKGRSIPEKIDRGMYVLSQLGATCILLFMLTF